MLYFFHFFYFNLTIFQIISGYTIMSGIHNNVLFFCSTFFFLFLFFTAFSFYFLFSMIEISQMPSTFNIWLYVRDILWKVWCFVEIWFLDVLTLLVSESGLWFSLLRLPQSQKPASESCSLEQNKFMSKNTNQLKRNLSDICPCSSSRGGIGAPGHWSIKQTQLESSVVMDANNVKITIWVPGRYFWVPGH